MSLSDRAPGIKTGGETSRREWMLRGAALLVVAAVITATLIFQRGLDLADPSSFIEASGYIGVLLLTFFASSSIVLPLPGVLGVFVAGGLLNPLLVSLVGGIGFALGEVTGYLIGFSGRGAMEKVRFYATVTEWVRRRGWLVVIVASVIPNPFFDIVGIAAGGLRMPLWRFLLFTGIGKTIKSLAFAYGGHYGLAWVLSFMR